MRIFAQRMWALSLRSPGLVCLGIGTAAALTVLLAGLSLLKAHGGIWPWWFHGLAVALITGSITTLLTRLHLREVSEREIRIQTVERMSHEMCTALQILSQCRYIKAEGQPPEQWAQWEGEALERIRVAAREILPTLVDFAPPPASRASNGREKLKSKAAAGSE